MSEHFWRHLGGVVICFPPFGKVEEYNCPNHVRNLRVYFGPANRYHHVCMNMLWSDGSLAAFLVKSSPVWRRCLVGITWNNLCKANAHSCARVLSPDKLPVCSLTQGFCGQWFRDVAETEYGQMLGEHPNLFIIYTVSGILQSSEYPKKSWPTILCPITCFLLASEHSFSFCKLLEKKTYWRRMRMLVVGYSCMLGCNHPVSINWPLHSVWHSCLWSNLKYYWNMDLIYTEPIIWAAGKTCFCCPV